MKKIRAMCGRYELNMLGEIPLHASISDDADRGKPTVVAEPDGERAMAFGKIAQEVEGLIGLGR
jgi:ATP-binding protein involved in chromosome partitioning